MATKRVKVLSLRGGTSTQRNDDLCSLICGLGINFSKCLPTNNDTFVVVCPDEANVDLLISNKTMSTLNKNGFQIAIPPQLKAKKTIVLKSLDKRINKYTEEELKQDIEEKNAWAKVEEVVKFKNIPYMLKIRFQDIKMARKAQEQGLKIKFFSIPSFQIEEEEFIPITPCYICYKYTHTVKDCPEKDKNVKLCSECAQRDHTFRECTNRDNPKCLNCSGQHRTLAAACPVRKELVKQYRETKNEKQKKFETENRTYCAVTKLQQEIPKVMQKQSPERTVLNLSSQISVTLLAIIIEAHLENLAHPGSFGRTVKLLMSKNNLPEIEMSDDAPSAAIFGAMTSNPCEQQQQQSAHCQNQQKSTEEEKVDGAAAVVPSATTSAAQSSDESDMEEEEMEEEREIEIQHTPVKEKAKKFEKSVPPAPPSSPTSRTIPKKSPVMKVTKENIQLKIFAAEGHKVPTFLPNHQLLQCMQTNRVKFIFNGDVTNEEDIKRFFKEGRISTKDFPIEIIDNTAFKKIRTGPAYKHDTGAKPKQKK